MLCSVCEVEEAAEDDVFNGRTGALIGPWWLCNECFAELTADMAKEDEEKQ